LRVFSGICHRKISKEHKARFCSFFIKTIFSFCFQYFIFHDCKRFRILFYSKKVLYFPNCGLTTNIKEFIINSDKKGGVRVELTKSEMEIMDVLWGSDRPLSRADLLARSEEKTWKDSSVHILLNGLLQKGAIQEAGLIKRSKTYGRIFAPTMTREEYFANTIFSHRYKPQIVGLFEALLRREDITKEDLDAIAAMIAQKNV